MGNVPRWAVVEGGLFFLAAGLSIVMLITDTNLRTDFNTVSSGYYSHWYVVLATAIVDLVGGALLFALRSRRALQAGAVGAGLLVLIYLGDILTYSSVGFGSASDFAQYLFGITYYGGDIRYLYDVVLSIYLAALVFGAIALLVTRDSAGRDPAAGSAEAETSGSRPE